MIPPLADAARYWEGLLTRDDILWQQMVFVHRHLREVESPHFRDLTTEEQVLYRMLRVGTLDVPDNERQMDQATWSMRHSSAMSFRLLEMVRIERARVSTIFAGSLHVAHLRPREIVWSATFAS